MLPLEKVLGTGSLAKALLLPLPPAPENSRKALAEVASLAGGPAVLVIKSAPSDPLTDRDAAPPPPPLPPLEKLRKASASDARGGEGFRGASDLLEASPKARKASASREALAEEDGRSPYFR